MTISNELGEGISPPLIYPMEAVYSYPPAPINQDVALTLDRKEAHLSSPNTTPDRPTAIYIHVPFCIHFCHFCGFVKREYSVEDSKRYDTFILEELRRTAERLPTRINVNAVYFGGGSASTLEIGQIERILSGLTDRFRVDPTAEITFEGEALTLAKPEYLKGLRKLGFQRLSFGVQTMNPEARRALNLKTPIRTLARVADEATSLFPEVCIDYMYGWPGFTAGQTEEDLRCVLRTIPCTAVEAFRFEPLDASPVLVAAFSRRFCLPMSFTQYALHYQRVSQVLEADGFDRRSYTVFSRSGSNQQRDLIYYDCFYGKSGGQVIGLGLGAQSFWNGAMWGAVTDWGQYVSGHKMGGAYACFTYYDPLEKELIGWPRRGHVENARLMQASRESYGRALERLVALGLLIRDSASTRVAPEAWAAVPALTYFLLPSNDRAEYSNLSSSRARERNLELFEEQIDAAVRRT